MVKTWQINRNDFIALSCPAGMNDDSRLLKESLDIVNTAI